MTNPFATQAPPAAPQQQPMISDTAAQQFAPQQPPAQAPNAFTQPAQDYAAIVAQGQHPVQQAYAAQAQGLPSQPWSPQQHAQNGQQMAAQAFAPPVPAQQPQQFAPPAQQAPQGFAPAQFAPPAQQVPQHAQAGSAFPAAAPAGGGYDPSLFGAPSAGGGGTYPKVRDIEGRLCLFVVKKRDAEGTDYNDKTKKTINYIANVAILDGGPVYSSPGADDVMAQPTLVSETTPHVVSDMIISQVGLQNRLKNDFVRGRAMRHPKGELEKQLLERFPGATPPQALFAALQQGIIQQHQLVSGTFFWTIVEDNSEQANQLVNAFAQHPDARNLML